MPRSPSGASARRSPRVLIKSLERNALHTSRIRDMVRLNGNRSKDYHDCIEWAGVQAWSNGKVGLSGVSYYAMNQWQVASLQPPHLAAMCMWEGAADWYRDSTHHGGIKSTFWDVWYPVQVTTIQYGLGERGYRSK